MKNIILKIKKNRVFADSIYTIICMSIIFINFLEANLGKYLSLENIIFSLVLYIAVSLLFYFACRLFFKKGAFIAPFLLLAIFSYASLCDGFSEEYFTFIKNYSIPQSLFPFTIIYVFIFSIITYLLTRMAKLKWFQTVTKVVITTMFVSQTSTYLWLYNKNENTALPKTNQSFGKIEDRNNVYLILIDGYPDDIVLEEHTGFQNNLTPFLQSKGFFVSKNSYSNYHFTLGSVSSLFMANYHHNTFKDYKFPSSDFSRIICGNNLVVKTFSNNGYRFIFAPSGVYSELEVTREYADIFISHSMNYDIFLSILNKTPLRKFSDIINVQYYLEPEDIIMVLKKQKNSIQSKPLFMYAHFMQVHDTIVTNQGKVQSGHIGFLDGTELSRRHLLESIKKLNAKIIKLINYITVNDPNSYIIICSDHGIITPAPNTNPEENRRLWRDFFLPSKDNKKIIKNRLKNYFAIHTPADKKRIFSEKSVNSNVNIFRSLFFSMGIKNVAFLEDEHYILNLENGFYKQYPESKIIIKEEME